MKTWYRHIAVYMIGFFLFPVVYQCIHQVHHHGHDKIEHSCEHHHEKAAESAYIYHSPEHCPICEYELVIQDLPCLTELALPTMPCCEQITFTFSGEVHKPAYSHKSPRAPPNT